MYVCRCCNEEIPTTRQHVEILVSLERPKPNMHASGRLAATACEECANGVADGVLHVARLWTPTLACAHLTTALF